jgi:hypothetical protein
MTSSDRSFSSGELTNLLNSRTCLEQYEARTVITQHQKQYVEVQAALRGYSWRASRGASREPLGLYPCFVEAII